MNTGEEVQPAAFAVAVVASELELELATGWARPFAVARKGRLLVVVDSSRSRDRGDELQRIARDSDDPANRQLLETVRRTLPDVEFELHRASGRGALEGLLKLLPARDVSLLLVPITGRLKGQAAENSLEIQLFWRAPCDTMLVRGETTLDFSRVLVVLRDGPHAATGLRWALEGAETQDGRVTALYVEQELGEDAALVASQALERLVRGVGNRSHLELRPLVAANADQAVREVCEQDWSLVVMGAGTHQALRRWLFGGAAEIVYQNGGVVAAARSAIPLASRLRQYLERRLQDWVPQLAREQRVSLVERVRSSSEWNFDFIALIGLSTVIAALGLLRNSGAVVIGAMLVAPLMTPLLGMGLALVQGNLVLFLNAARTVLLGFLLALLLGLGLGWALPGMELTPEMESRGAPNVLDLIVALVSGIAAAYASGRPNLLSALPGVAIAAALVPPVATAGIGLAHGAWPLALGAILLFVTNIVAIVLGAAASLWVVGIRGTHRHGGYQRWSGFVAVGLAVVTLALAGFEAHSAPTLQPAVERELRRIVREQGGGELDRAVLWQASDGLHLRLHLLVPGPVSDACLKELAAAARRHVPRPAAVQVRTEFIRQLSLP